MDDTNKLKQQYNDLLKRYEKASLFMDDDNIPIPERERYLDRLIDLVKQFQPLLDKIGSYRREEVLEGFKIPSKTT